MKTYKRINEEFLDKLEIEDDRVDVNKLVYEEIENWITTGVALSFNPQVLPDAYYQPNDSAEFKILVYRTIDVYGNNADLNWIDTSAVVSMADLFANNMPIVQGLKFVTPKDYHEFNGDISRWNVSGVKTMASMFYGSEFNGNISDWDVSGVRDMHFMFSQSKFNGNISSWNVSSLFMADNMFFLNNEFRGDLSKWRVDDSVDIKRMMNGSKVYTSDYPKHKSYKPSLFSRIFK